MMYKFIVCNVTFLVLFFPFISVVSELWGQQCVRLKVTVKSDNCGENADCSGKGICYSNMSMVSPFKDIHKKCKCLCGVFVCVCVCLGYE